MTENELLNKLHAKIVSSDLAGKITEQEMMAFCKAKTALGEIEQYRAIGTVEELKTMKEHGGFTVIELAEISAALGSLGEYCAIGTLEECRAAVEKHNSKESKEMPCNHCRNYYDCKSDKKDNCDSCFFLYPTKEWQMEHTEEYKRGYAKAMEECREAIEKQKAKSVIFDTPLRVLECPMCGNYVQTVQDDEGCTNGTIPKYCKNCGQKLNWGDEK